MKEKKNPRTVLQHGSGIRFLSAWTCDFFLPIGMIAYAKMFFNMLLIQKFYPYLVSINNESSLWETRLTEYEVLFYNYSRFIKHMLGVI